MTAPTIRDRDLLVFFRCFHTTLGSGLSLLPSLELLARQTESEGLARACSAACRLVLEGRPLSQALRAQGVFSEFQCRLLEVGERTGTLHAVLGRLAAHQEQGIAQKQKIRRALEMPGWTLLVCLLLVTLLPCLLFDGVLAFLRDAHVAIPWPTKLVMNFAACLKSPWFWIVLGGSSLLLVSRARGRATRVLRLLPGLESLLRALALQRFCESLGMMLEIGVPLLDALQLAAASAGRPALQRAMVEVLEQVKNGTPLPRALAADPDSFPKSLVQTAWAGEECGRLPDLLQAISRLYELEVDTRLNTLTQVAEPLVLCLVGCVVGFTVVATLLPLVSLLNGL